MEQVSNRSVQFISEQGLCNGCGTCRAICPHGSISINESFSGLLQARVDETSCTACGKCLDVCSAYHITDEVIKKDGDHFSGRPVAAFSGYATSKTLREEGQSGGLATALVSFLLENKIASLALLTGTGNDPFRPGPVFIDKQGDWQPAVQSSKYCPVSLNTCLDRIDDFTNLVYVGLPCHVRGLMNYLQHTSRINEKPFIIGLFCDSVMSFRAMEFMAGKIKNRGTVRSFRYKDKRFGRFPGNCIVETENALYQVPNTRRLFAKRLLKPPYCYLCHDKLNMYADISLGDGWGLGSKYEGLSAALCFTEKGKEYIEKAADANYICLENVPAPGIIKGQGIAARRSDWNTCIRIWKGKGNYVPRYGPEMPSGNDKNMGRRTAHQFEQSIELFSSVSAAQFERRLRTRILAGYGPFRIKTGIAGIMNRFGKGRLLTLIGSR